MNEVFADTSGWANAFVRTELHHSLAAAFLRQWQADRTQVVTTNYVLNEVSALLTSLLRVRSRSPFWTRFGMRPGWKSSTLTRF